MAVNYGELIATTIEHRQSEVADNVTKSRALFYRLNEKGHKKTVAGGRSIYQPLEFTENGNFQWYSGGETLNTTQQEVMDVAEYAWKQAACGVFATGLETDIQNAGKEQIIDLLEARVKNAEKTVKNQLATGVYSDGIASGGKQIGGLQLLVADTPTNTVGGINGSTYSWWRNISFDATTDGGSAMSASNAISYMNRVYFQLVRGEDKPDLVSADNNYFRFYMEALQPNARFTNPKMADAGFTNIDYMGAPVVLDGGIGGSCPTNHMYFLNTDYIYLVAAKNRDFVAMKPREAINQDATVRFLLWAGNLVVSNRSVQGVLKD